MGEPLFEDVCTALRDADKDIPTYACRYGISGKDVPPASIHAVYQNMISAAPKRHFTLGITDDVTHLSLPDIPIDVHTKIQSTANSGASALTVRSVPIRTP